MRRHVTVRQIAQRVGMHFTTVALALKDDPRVRLATRTRIQMEARGMGYKPDPLLSALSAYRQAKRKPSFREALAWITSFPTRDGWKNKCFTLFHAGASERAEELGYRLEEFWLHEKGRDANRSSKILSNRGIRGLLLCPLPHGQSEIDLDWRRFASVSFGYSVAKPAVDQVSAAHYQAALLMVRTLWSQGHRRIGLANPPSFDSRTGGLWKAGFRSGLEELTGRDRAPIFSNNDFGQRNFLKWLNRYRLDAVMTTQSSVLRWVNKVSRSTAVKPRVVFLNLQKSGDLSGCIEPSLLLGKTAVELLADLLRRGQLGIPALPRRVLLEGRWSPGLSHVRKLI